MQELRKRLELQSPSRGVPSILNAQVTNLFHLPEPGSVPLLWSPGSGSWLLPSPSGGQTSAARAGGTGRRWPGRRGDAPRAPGEAPCPPQVGLAGGTVSAISELLIGFTATALTTPLLALTSCLNHHSNSSERCDLLFKTHSAALFDPLARCAAGRAGGAVGARLGEHSPRTRGFRDTQGHSGEGGGKETSPSCSR